MSTNIRSVVFALLSATAVVLWVLLTVRALTTGDLLYSVIGPVFIGVSAWCTYVLVAALRRGDSEDEKEVINQQQS